MMSISIGPLAFPVTPLVWLAALWLGHLLAVRWTHRRHGKAMAQAASDALWRSALAGFAAARLAFVIPAWREYAASPWSVLDIRDGGWSPALGMLVAAAVLALHAGRRRALSLPLAAASAVVLLTWAGGQIAFGLHRERPLPDVAVVAPDGREARLPALAQGRTTVLNLWATWCAPCRAELPALAAVQASRPDVRFLFVNQGEDASTVQAFLQRQPYRLQDVWLDRRSATGLLVGSSGLPTTLVYDSDGRLVLSHFGVISEAALRARLGPAP